MKNRIRYKLSDRIKNRIRAIRYRLTPTENLETGSLRIMGKADALFWYEGGMERFYKGELLGKEHWMRDGRNYHPKRPWCCHVAPSDNKLAIRHNPELIYKMIGPTDIEHTSGCLNTYPSFRFTYGIIEMRCKIGLAKYVRSAFWMWNIWQKGAVKDDLDQYGEIDIFEIDGLSRRMKVGFLRNYRFEEEKTAMERWTIRCIAPDRFQRFTMEWRREFIKIWVDGVLVFVLTDPTFLEWFSHNEMWLLAYQTIYTEPSGKISSEMLVDYISVWP